MFLISYWKQIAFVIAVISLLGGCYTWLKMHDRELIKEQVELCAASKAMEELQRVKKRDEHRKKQREIMFNKPTKLQLIEQLRNNAEL